MKRSFRDFPLQMHRDAPKAHQAGECAHEQGKFWEMHAALFDQQKNLKVPDLKKRAEELGLDLEKFNACLDSGKYAQEIREDMADGSRYGVTGTPAFFINGRPLTGAQPYERFRAVIEEELELAGVPIPPEPKPDQAKN